MVYRVSITHRESPKHRAMVTEYLVTSATDPETAKSLALYEETRDLSEFTARVLAVHVEAEESPVLSLGSRRAPQQIKCTQRTYPGCGCKGYHLA